MRPAATVLATGLAAVLVVACGSPSSTPPAPAAASRGNPAPRHVLLVTIDTLRADRVGAYGYTKARTPVLDALAASGVRAARAYATAPVTLPSHASMLTGRYPPAHGARHNGVALPAGTPTLATALKAAGYATGAFVSAFPLDRRFGLAAGFDVYGDRWPRGPGGRPADERAGQITVDEALAWRRAAGDARTFLWVHLFEPHAPYGDASTGRPVSDRYDDEIAEADRQLGRLLDGLAADRDEMLVIVAADHGEAFGEHGEIGHSLFLYDTTLQVPLIVQGPDVSPGRVIQTRVSLVDIAPTVVAATKIAFPGTLDGQPLFLGARAGDAMRRQLYAETMAPFEDFGWSPMRSVRDGSTKYILAPSPEMYETAADPREVTNLVATAQAEAARLKGEIGKFAAATSAAPDTLSPEARRRLQSLGYLGGSGPRAGQPLADPKDRRALAARLAEVTSGELQGPALERTLLGIVTEDPGNPQARVRLGYVLSARGDCAAAVPHFRAAIAAHLPSADAHLGLAGCLMAQRQGREAAAVLEAADQVEPDNPVVIANRGALLSDAGQPLAAVPLLRRALTLDPDLHQARFTLAMAHARAGQRAEATQEASTLLQRLPAGAPQRPEVQRLLDAVR